MQLTPEEITEGLLGTTDYLAERHCRLDDYMGDLLSKVLDHFVAGTLSPTTQDEIRVEYDRASQEQAEAEEKLQLLYEHLGVAVESRVC